MSEKQDTLPPKSIGWHWHRYTEWRDVACGDIMQRGLRIGAFIEQRRDCLVCQKVLLRTVTTSVFQ